jgi:hypothetical protein
MDQPSTPSYQPAYQPPYQLGLVASATVLAPVVGSANQCWSDAPFPLIGK